MTGLPVHHIAIAVPSIEAAKATFESLTGHACSQVEEIPSQGVNVAFLGSLELIEPRGSESPVARFLQRRGTALHHIAFQVPDLEAELEKLSANGVRLIDSVPRAGAHGHRVAFLHPSASEGVLIELVEESSGPDF
jgi:methylmalonyl-CoA/ethylmalonyl-CoA epimerase